MRSMDNMDFEGVLFGLFTNRGEFRRGGVCDIAALQGLFHELLFPETVRTRISGTMEERFHFHLSQQAGTPIP